MSKNCKTTKTQFTITQINSNQFLIEGEYKTIKIIGENEYSLTYMEIEDGPLLHIGKDFLGMGIIQRLEIIDSEKDNYIIIKVLTQ